MLSVALKKTRLLGSKTLDDVISGPSAFVSTPMASPHLAIHDGKWVEFMLSVISYFLNLSSGENLSLVGFHFDLAQYYPDVEK